MPKQSILNKDIDKKNNKKSSEKTLPTLKLFKDHWIHRAEKYDSLHWVNNDQFLRQMIAICNPQVNDLALDLGCGTGKIANTIAPLVRKIIGIDSSSAMLEQAHKMNDNIEFLRMDCENMTFRSNRFDLITARMVFHHVNNIPQALKNTYRVLKPHGRIVITEGVPQDHLCWERYVEIFKLKEKRHIFSEAILINFLGKAGFNNIALYPYFSKKIFKLHHEAEDHFYQAYNMKIVENDILMDWKFVTLIASK